MVTDRIDFGRLQISVGFSNAGLFAGVGCAARQDEVVRGALVQARLSVDGSGTASVALWDWLRSEHDLRGRVRQEPVPASPGAMGAVCDLVVTLSSSGTAAVLARSVQVWLTQRHRDITLTLTGPDGQTVSIDARRVVAGEVGQLLRTTLGVHQDASPPAPAPAQSRPAQQRPAEVPPGSQEAP